MALNLFLKFESSVKEKHFFKKNEFSRFEENFLKQKQPINNNCCGFPLRRFAMDFWGLSCLNCLMRCQNRKCFAIWIMARNSGERSHERAENTHSWFKNKHLVKSVSRLFIFVQSQTQCIDMSLKMSDSLVDVTRFVAFNFKE